jgi:hypothetical protein
MPQLQNLVLTDRAATPVNHTFLPRDIADGVGTVVESSGVPIGDNRFSVTMRRTAEGRYKSTLKGVFPIVQTQTINGISTPVVVRTAYADITFSFDGSSTEQERKDVVGMMASSLGASQVLVNDTVVKNQGVY